MNRICLSECGRFVECWNNGTRCYSIHVSGSLHDAVGKAREYFRKWAGDEGELSKELAAKLRELDTLFARMAFGEQWR